MKQAFTILAGLVVLNSTIAFGQIGGLDSTFGQGGKVSTLVTFTSGANALALQGDGKIVAAGYAYNGTKYEFAVARYNSDGSMDTTFGMEGTDTTRIRTGNSIATGVAIEPNGKIIVVGHAGNTTTPLKDTTVQFALARYTKNGLLDTTFGNNGIDTFIVGSTDDEAKGVAIQPDGKILVAGFSYAKSGIYSDFALIRVDTNGVIDTTFDTIATKGKVLTAIGTHNDKAYTLALQKDGKILLGGYTNNYNYGNWNFAVARYLASGSLDLSFDSIGFNQVDINSDTDICYSIAIQPNGKIVLGGVSKKPGKYFFALARVDSDGTIDSTFGTFGKDTTSFYGNDNEIKSVAIDTSGKILAAGFSYVIANKLYDFTLARYDSTGLIDSIFGSDTTGKVITGFGIANAEANAMVIQHDDKILLAGYALNAPKEQFALARYNIDTIALSSVDLIAENNPLLIYPNPVHSNAILKYSLTNDEMLTIRVYDLTGRMILSVLTDENEPAGSYSKILNLEALPAGCYIVNLSNNNSQNLSVKIVKQ